jgi:hypothetical protein
MKKIISLVLVSWPFLAFSLPINSIDIGTVQENSNWTSVRPTKLTKSAVDSAKPGGHSVHLAEERTMCRGEAIPTGWVIIRLEACIRCPSRPGDPCVQFVIRNLTGLPKGTRSNMCVGSTLPVGWKILRTYPCISCGYGTNRCVESEIVKM